MNSAGQVSGVDVRLFSSAASLQGQFPARQAANDRFRNDAMPRSGAPEAMVSVMVGLAVGDGA